MPLCSLDRRRSESPSGIVLSTDHSRCFPMDTHQLLGTTFSKYVSPMASPRYHIDVKLTMPDTEARPAAGAHIRR